MRKSDSEQGMLKDFAEFIEAEPLAPSTTADRAVLGRVARDLRPAPWSVLGKLTLVEVSAGLLTLAVCPQFGLGVSRHNPWIHALHVTTSPAIFYLLCGLFFVIFGAGLGGLILNRAEIRAVGNGRYPYFFGYSVVAYLILVSLGAEAFVASSVFWILGAFLGNALGFAAVIRLRFAAT